MVSKEKWTKWRTGVWGMRLWAGNTGDTQDAQHWAYALNATNIF